MKKLKLFLSITLLIFAAATNTIAQGTSSICIGSSATLTAANAGGRWVSSNTGVAVIDPISGVITGLSTGNLTVSYNLGGSIETRPMAVLAAPEHICGPATVCSGATAMLSNSVAGGEWLSSDAAIAAVNSASGAVTGVSAGTAAITYRTGSCMVSTVVSVNPSPAAIVGNNSLCSTAQVTLSNAVSGGVWSCSNDAVADVNPLSGVVSGVSSGTVNITYTMPGSCNRNMPFTVMAAPPAISGTAQVCTGSAITLSNSVAGGKWSCSPASYASIDSASGIMSGLSAGTATVTYALNANCSVTRALNVNQGAPSLETSPKYTPALHNICIGNKNIQLTTYLGTGGHGVWSSSNTGVVTITNGEGGTAAGQASTVAMGTATISYTIANGCFATYPLTVNAMPTMTGAPTVCKGTTTTMSGSPAGGQWFSSNPSSANAGIINGVVRGANFGNAIIYYRMYGYDKCAVSQPITVTNCTTGKMGRGEDVAALDNNQPFSLTEEAKGYTVYPNPSDGNIVIKQNVSGNSNVSMKVVNYMGQTVYAGSMVFNNGTGNLRLGSVPQGIYLVEIEGEQGKKDVVRIAVEK
ncbi:MAG: Ig-like domain-containing protein [Bacteroidota bacterium]